MKKNLITLGGLLLVLALNLYFRGFPVNFPQLKTQAKITVEQKIVQEIIREIDKKFPNFSDLAKNRLINTLLANYKKERKQEIKKRIREEYLKLKDNYQDTKGQTYLMELDCWNWARYVNNVLTVGHPGDKAAEGRQLDSLMLVPTGKYLGWNQFLFYFSAFLYKLFAAIKPVPLFTFLFYLPLFFTTIFIILLYLFSRRLGGDIAAVISCLFAGLYPIFLVHSSAGWFDMDILNLVFPLLAVWAYLAAGESVLFKKRLFLIFLSAFWVGLFSFNWLGWWFIFLIIILYEIYSLLNLISANLQYKEKNSALFKQHVISLFLFVFFGLFWVVIFLGPKPLLFFLQQIKQALWLSKPLIQSSIWPNVFSAVGEVEKKSFAQIIRMASGVPVFILSLVSLLALFVRSRRKEQGNGFGRNSVVILMLWFFSMFLASFRGVRFFIFLILPMAISVGWFLGEAYAYFRDKKKKWGICLVLAMAIILGDTFISRGYKQAVNIFPLMEDSWYKTLATLDKTTTPEAVINSWWDFGDWFKTAARRRVIFDGQSQNTPQAYWMARVLLSRNEDEAIRILRMLNNGGNKAFEIINAEFGDSFKSILFLEKILLLEPAQAKEALRKNLSAQAADEAAKLLFTRPSPAYFIVDYTMLDKMGWISYLGNWDFLKVYLMQNLNKAEKEEIIARLAGLGVEKEKAQELYQELTLISKAEMDSWVSQRFKFYEWLSKGEEKNGLVLFNNGLVYQPNTEDAYFYSLRIGNYRMPKSVFVVKQNNIEEKEYSGQALVASVLVFKEGPDWRAVLLDRQLGSSLFSRLYFLNGAGLKYFRPFLKEEKAGEGHIGVFEISWE